MTVYARTFDFEKRKLVLTRVVNGSRLSCARVLYSVVFYYYKCVWFIIAVFRKLDKSKVSYD